MCVFHALNDFIRHENESEGLTRNKGGICLGIVEGCSITSSIVFMFEPRRAEYNGDRLL